MKQSERLGYILIQKLHLTRLLEKDSDTKDFVEMMYARGDKERTWQCIWGQRVFLVILFLLLLLAAILYSLLASEPGTALQNGNELVRQTDNESVDIQIHGRSESMQWEKELSLPLNTREYTAQEMEKLEKTVTDYISNHYLGNNTDASHVVTALSLPQQIPSTDVILKWSMDGDYILENGKIQSGKVPEKGVDTELMVKAVSRNWKKTMYYPIHLVQRVWSEEDLSIKKVKSTLKQAMKEQATSAIVVLPEKVDGLTLNYEMEGEGKSFTLVYLVLGVLVLLPVIWSEQIKKKLKEREEELFLDYPGIVNKVMLLLSAGLTIRMAIERLVKEYEQEKARVGKTRFVYEELCIVMQEIRDGISEGTAIEHLGKRCRLLPYMRFASIITQNMKKGAEGMLDILEQEALDALEQRKERVLQLGEKAGTKLLFPMMLMLGLVMGIIMVPAFMTM